MATSASLPVEEVGFGFDVQAVAEDSRSAMRCWSQANDVRIQRNLLVIGVDRGVIERNSNAHEVVSSECCGGRK